MVDRIENAKDFSEINLKTGIHQIRMKSEYIELTTFTAKCGQLEYLVVPAGTCSAAALFQPFLNDIFHEYMVEPSIVFFEHLLIFSKDNERH